MLSHPHISVETNVEFADVRGRLPHRRVVYTGPIDAYFDYRHGRLPYRSLRFEHEHLPRVPQFQAVGVVNYPNDFAYTRITEFKHLTGQVHEGTTIAHEFPRGGRRSLLPDSPSGERGAASPLRRARQGLRRRHLRGQAGALPVLQHGPGRRRRRSPRQRASSARCAARRRAKMAASVKPTPTWTGLHRSEGRHQDPAALAATDGPAGIDGRRRCSFGPLH